MTDEQFVQRLRDLFHNYLNQEGTELLYGETIETKNGKFDVQLTIEEHESWTN